ncbi:MAG: tRNA guanosine(34) transglycosylase Tgt, partial [Acidobacteriota bacterium]
VEFRSHLDGSRHFLSPESSIEIQRALGADIIMAFDDCTPYPVSAHEAEASMLRSMRWAKRSKTALRESEQALFGIVQGSVFPNLRRISLGEIESIGFPGVALGGFSVGEPKLLMHELLTDLSTLLPAEKPHYLMGVGTPVDIVLAVENGIDMFDCVLPTRNARNGFLYTWNGVIRIKNARFKNDERPLDEACGCPVCQRHSRAYLRHLFNAGEILSSILNTYHNLFFYFELMEKIREAVRRGELRTLSHQLVEIYGPVS